MRPSLRILALLILSLTACCPTPPSERNPVRFSGLAFFSLPWDVQSYRLPAKLDDIQLHSDLQAALDRTNGVLSTYQDNTELMRFNRSPVGLPMQVSPLLDKAFSTARQVSAASGGVYDVTVGPLVNLWGFGPQAAPSHTPDTAIIGTARSRVDWRAVTPIDIAIWRRGKDVMADLSSLGEGAGVDELAAVLERHGLRNYRVEIAGTLRIAGRKPDGSPWNIAIERPDGSGEPDLILHLRAPAAVSTSGSYRNFHIIDGVRYSHTIDPRTGYPVTHHGVSVTVVMPHESAMVTDAWTTALNALGPDAGLALAARRGIAAYYRVDSGHGLTARYSPAFAAYLKP